MLFARWASELDALGTTTAMEARRSSCCYEPEIVHALRSQLSWTHLRELILLDAPLKRRFYVELSNLTELPRRELLERKLMEVIAHARAHIADAPKAIRGEDSI